MTSAFRNATAGDLLTGQGAKAEFRHDVLRGLTRPERALPGKYLWDETGSRLFATVTKSPCYYATGAEMTLLREAAPDVATLVGPRPCIVEFGSGSCHKVEVLFAALPHARGYVAIDISEAFLEISLQAVRAAHPDLDVRHVCADYSRDLPTLPLLEGGSVLGFFPGTSIANMPPPDARRLLTRIREALGMGWLLLGLDPNRDASRLREAYGNPLMAAFHENLLRRMARELGASVRPEDFRHEARLIADPARVEACLVAQRATTIGIDEAAFPVKAGEGIRTDLSWKYAPDEFRDLAASAGWSSERGWTDPDDLFHLTLLRAR